MNATSANCPQCGETVTMDNSNPYRPFCSKRCRLIDLGEWLEGSRRIPTDEPAPYHDSDDNGDPIEH